MAGFSRALGALGYQDAEIKRFFDLDSLKAACDMNNIDGRQHVISNENLLSKLAANPKYPQAKQLYDLIKKKDEPKSTFMMALKDRRDDIDISLPDRLNMNGSRNYKAPSNN